MPFTVITLTKVPPGLRGDLTKWMQEIATGVYIGNFSTRVRDNLWKRVCDAVGSGEATLSYTARNEIGYDFQTYQTNRKMINCDGIPLVLVPAAEKNENGHELKNGFSKASGFHHARISTAKSVKNVKDTSAAAPSRGYVVIDVETTGLNETRDKLIELGAVKFDGSEVKCFECLINTGSDVPTEITKMTGITAQMLAEDGTDLDNALKNLVNFIGDLPIVGYNVRFDIKFINESLRQCSMQPINNKIVDLYRVVKKEKLFLGDYKLQTVLGEYGINKKVPHRALKDAKLIYELSCKVNKLGI